MSESKIVDLVFEGGGMKGFAFTGALRALADHQYRPGRLLGTSIGSLCAVMLAGGYSARELYEQLIDPITGELRLLQIIQPFPLLEAEQIDLSATRRLLEEFNFSFLPDGIEGGFDTLLARRLMKNQKYRGFFAFIEKGGMNDPGPYVDWIESLLAAKISAQPDVPLGKLSLAQFHKITGSALSMIAADVTNPTMLILNHITAPDCPVAQAVCMATAAPPFFPPVTWKGDWGLYRGRELTGNQIVDGVFLSNFPIELFLTQHPTVTEMMGKPDEQAGVLGLLLDESKEVPGAPQFETGKWQLMLADVPGLNLTSSLLTAIIEARDRRAIESAAAQIVRIPAMGYSANKFDLTPGQLQPLLNAGYNAMVTHLETYQIPSGALNLDEAEQRQVDNKAIYIVQGDVTNYTITQNVSRASSKSQITAVKHG